jgi:hypothetical protein
MRDARWWPPLSFALAIVGVVFAVAIPIQR